VIVLVLGGSILASLKWPPKAEEQAEEKPEAVAEPREQVGVGS
jgi:hypothetical protein